MSGIREFIRGALFDNLGLKIISLICALGFFAFIHGGERGQRTFAVPVVSLMPPPSVNRMVVKPPPAEIAVTLSGPKTQIDAISGNDLGTVQLDLRSGLESTVLLKPADFDIPPGLQVEQIFPPQIDIQWDDVIHRKVPVQVPWTGECPAGFAVKGAVVANPGTVEATGPRAIINGIQYAATASFNVSGLGEGTHNRSLDLAPPPPQVTFSTDRVAATVEIERQEHDMPFKGLLIEVVGAPKATTKPPTVGVRVRGAPSIVDGLRAESLVPRVELPSDIDLTKPGSRLLPVTVEVTGATVEVDPPKVLVKW